MMLLLRNLPDGRRVEKEDLLYVNGIPPIKGVLPHVLAKGDNDLRRYILELGRLLSPGFMPGCLR
eukprot:6717630-Prorocentrum_lima.AAC.1